MRELERITVQEEMIKQERQWMQEHLESTRGFLHTVTPATKMREPFLKPSPASTAIVRDTLQKQLLIQRQELTKSIEVFEDELIGLNISIEQLKGARANLEREVKAKDDALCTDTAALHLNPTGSIPHAPPNTQRALLKPRSSWTKGIAEVLEDAGFVFKNATRRQVKGAAVRRSRGIVDENFRLKLIEMITRMANKSDLARPYLNQRLLDVRSEIDKAHVTVEHLQEAVSELTPPMERAQLQAQMRNQRPASEFVDDSGARALKMEVRRWEGNMGRQMGALNQVKHDLHELKALEAQTQRMLANDSGSQDTDATVLRMQSEGSPIPPALLDTISPKKTSIRRGGSSPSNHHIFASYRLPDKTVGMRSVSALGHTHRLPSTMPRLQKHVTMTSNLMDAAPPNFWQPPKGLPPQLLRPGSRAHHVPSMVVDGPPKE